MIGNKRIKLGRDKEREREREREREISYEKEKGISMRIKANKICFPSDRPNNQISI